MNEQFFYIQADGKVYRHSAGHRRSRGDVGNPTGLVEDWKRENPSHLNSDEAIAADIARVVAVRAALRAESCQEHACDVSNWYERRPPLMNERACDLHENGIRAWLVK
jgi:hypothetical protein